MKIAFISDIHGNATALEAVLTDIENKKVDKIYVLGDLCFRGPEPMRALELVRSLNTDVIKGNADEWVVRGINKGEVPDHALEMMSKERDWTAARLNDDCMNYLANLPTELRLEFGQVKVHAFHATPDSLFEVLPPFEKDEILMKKMLKEDAELYIYAHIHKPFIRFLNGKCLMNIGSVGLPFDGLRKSSYGLLEINEADWQISIVRVDYEVYKVVESFSEIDYPNIEQVRRILLKASL